ncbi:circadian clock KaiB family protein [Methylobacter psychrophilus]|uniref:circadian clock KaiB family protein n=1 Tax=Methylobacter psychrophilus TaxID=96941 RepID=UPI0021D4DDC9|nr:circadian clock KaiB family protein [Methylobacter psychrophilus]
MNNISSIPKHTSEISAATHVFRLYIAGEAPNSILALHNLKALCLELYRDDYRIDVVDVLLSPEKAWAEGVIVTPMVLRVSPEPVVKIIGNLNNTDQVLGALGLVIKDHD